MTKSSFSKYSRFIGTMLFYNFRRTQTILLTQPHLYRPLLLEPTTILCTYIICHCFLGVSFLSLTTGNLAGYCVATSFTFRGHLRLCFGYFSFVLGLDSALKTHFTIDRFCLKFLAISKPWIDLNFALGWIITNYLRDATENEYFCYLHLYPNNQHKIMTIIRLRSGVRL